MQLSCREVRRGTGARGATVPVRHGGSSPRQPPQKSRPIIKARTSGASGGYSTATPYSDHPLACAAALATLEVYRDFDLFARGRRLAPIWEQAAHELAEAPYVIDIRIIGLLAAIDLKPRDGVPGARGTECAKRCFEEGTLIRSGGDTLVLSPPLIIAESEIEMVFATIRRTLEALD
jgi:adenosylmethionine-8-amino-7-oxononanoate aminotransferase